MSYTPIKYCPITDQLVSNSSISPDYFEYDIVFNNNSCTIRLALIEGWAEGENIKHDEKLVLQAMLYNDEWPIDKETIITPAFIAQILRLGEYPRNFDEKLNYYLLKCYLKGGKEYRTIEFDIAKYLTAYAQNDNEFSRIIDGLNSKELIKLPNNENVGNRNYTVKLNLTEKGIQLANQLNQASIAKQPKRYTGTNKPSITIVATKKDDFYAELLKELLLTQGISVTSNNGIDDDDFSTVTNSKNGLYSKENDYVIFIKSESSDRNNSFGSILDIAIEAHENTDKRNFNYLYFAFIDDSKRKTRPRIDNYYNCFYDFRIKSNRKLLLLDIYNDWKRRYPENVTNSKTYNFPVFKLNAHEKTWLQVIYQKFLNNEKFEYRRVLSKMWDVLPRNFEPSSMNPALIRNGSELTVLGIWTIDPQSKIPENFDKVVFAIREILKRDNVVAKVTSDDIIALNPELTHQEILQVFNLFSNFSNFSNSLGTNNDDLKSSIGVDRDEIYRTYRNYTGIEDLINELLKFSTQSPEIQTDAKDQPLNGTIDLKAIHAHKTKFAYRDMSNVKAVMGVTEIAADVAEIIDSLPIQKEKGQMIGIFGKWGRGKSFLLREIWNVLKEKKDNEVKIYTKIEYHAWKYQETPASWAYLYEKFASEYLGEKKGFRKILAYYIRLTKLNYERLGVWPIIRLGLAVLATIITPIVTGVLLKWYFSIALIPILLVAFLNYMKQLYKEFSPKAVDLIKLYTVKHSFKEALGLQANIQDELIKLLKVWIPEDKLGKNKVLLVVEDIDRCTEERIIQNIDALRVMLEDEEICKRVIIITAIDERILKNAIRIKYDSILENNENTDAGERVTMNELMSEYLDKLFISAIKLGGLTSDQRNEYINELLEEEVDREVIKNYYKNEELEQKKQDYRDSNMSEVLAEAFFNDPSYQEMQQSFREQERLLEQVGEKGLDLAIENGDFVVKDGDLGLMGSKGNVTSMPEIEDTVEERLKNQNRFEKLSAIEVDLICKVVRKWSSATPRRVRIYYYRYLLSKNLLINKYDQLKRVNVWQNKEGINAMMHLILDYTKAHDPEQICLEKAKIIESTDEQTIMSFAGGQIAPYRVDYLCLLEVLELVIAY